MVTIDYFTLVNKMRYLYACVGEWVLLDASAIEWGNVRGNIFFPC